MLEEKKRNKSKLHELLAVEGDLKGKVARVTEEAITTFRKGLHFHGASRRLTMFEEGSKHLEDSGAETQALTTTVNAKLAYIQKDLIRFWDALLQKEGTNQDAVADLIVEGEIIGEGLPATWLLGMEAHLKHLRTVYETIPTLPPGIEWEKDETLVAADGSKGVYRASPDEIKLKTEKTIEHKVLVPSTKEHPAQVEKWTENKPVGQFVVSKVSGALTPAEKSDILGRIDVLIRATKKARMRANNTEVRTNRAGKKLFAYING